jgi:hypothetical protein
VLWEIESLSQKEKNVASGNLIFDESFEEVKIQVTWLNDRCKFKRKLSPTKLPLLIGMDRRGIN